MSSKTSRVMCGTCNYWTGAREPIMTADNIERVEIIDKTGICENGNWRFQGEIRKYDSRCCKYSKWTELI